MPIITISRQEGSFSQEIAAEIAENFKWPYLDKGVIEKALEDNYGLEAENFNKHDEKKPSLVDTYMHDYEQYNNDLKLYLLNAAIENKGCVILGRGGAFFLKDIPGVFRLRLISSEKTRINRIMEKHNCDFKHAEKIMHHTDHDRSGFNKFFYGKSWDDPSFYDMVLNTDKLTTDAVSEIVTGAVHTCIKGGDEKSTKSALNELLLLEKIRKQILFIDKIPIHLFEIDVKDGTVTLSGTVEVESRITECENCVMTVPGVKTVNNNLLFIQHKNW
jgi:cytidylate kinase